MKQKAGSTRERVANEIWDILSAYETSLKQEVVEDIAAMCGGEAHKRKFRRLETEMAYQKTLADQRADKAWQLIGALRAETDRLWEELKLADERVEKNWRCPLKPAEGE